MPRLCLSLAVAVALLQAQNAFGPDEVRAHSLPYVPPAPATTLRTQVNLVEVPVVVRDGKHHAIAGLTQSAFEIYDAGKKQTITNFTVETFTPGAVPSPGTRAPAAADPTSHGTHAARYIVLCFDNLTTNFDSLKRTKDAALKFIHNSLAPDDLVAVVATASSGSSTFTADPAALAEAIDKITPQRRLSDDLGGGCPRITAYQAYLITNHLDNETLEGVAAEDMACKHLRHPDAVRDVQAISQPLWEQARAYSQNILASISSVVDGLGKMPGRRMLLLASDGFLGCDLEYQEDELITRAVHAEVVINALNAKGLITIDLGRPIDAPPPRSRSIRTQIAETHTEARQAQAKDDGMAVLALGTGGAFYTNNNDLFRGFEQLGELPETVYVLGYSPSDATPDGRFHALRVKLANGNHYTLQSRMGYTAPKKAAETAPLSTLDTAVAGTETPTDVPCAMSITPGDPLNGVPSLVLEIRVDTHNLKYEMKADRSTQNLTFVGMLSNAAGAFVTAARADVEFAFKQGTIEKIGDQGINFRLPLRAPAGTYTLRSVVQESLNGKLTASNQQVELK